MGGASTAPFVGRTGELATVRAVIRRARDGVGGAIVVQGPAGIGKTFLVDAALADADGLQVCRVACGELEREIAFAGIATALGLRRSSSDTAAAAIADLIGDPAGGDLRFRIVDDVVDLLERQAIHRPVVLVLDDVHRADPGTLLVVKRLVRDAALRSVTVVCTRRAFPVRPDVDDALGAANTIVLEPLLDAEVDALTSRVLGAAPDASLTAAVSGCGGSPLFTVELLEALRSDGRITIDDGHAALIDGELPASLRLTILAQLSFLDDEAVSMLRTAACFGSTFDMRDLALVLDRPAAEVIRVLDPAVRAAIIAGDGEHATFRHDLVRDAIYDDTPPSMRVALHADIASRLRNAGRPVTEQAPHVLLSARDGDVVSIDLLRDAARTARPLSPPVAVALLQRAVEITPLDYMARDDLRLELATALSDAGRQQDAEDLARAVLSRQRDTATMQRARSVVVQTLMLRERARDAVDVLEAMAGDDSLTGVERARVLAKVARAWSQTGDVEHTKVAATEALALAEETDDVEVRCQVLWALTYLEVIAGDPSEVLRMIGEAAELARRGVVEPATRAEIAHGYLYTYGIIEPTRAAARAFAEEEALQAEAAGHLWVVSMLHEIRAFDHLRWGELDDARREAAAAIQAAEDVGSWRFLSSAYATLARAAIYEDELDAAGAWLEAAESTATEEDNFAISTVRTFQPRYEYEEARGRPDRAVAFLWDAFGRLEKTVIGSYTMVLHSPRLVRLLIDAGRDADARRVLAFVDAAQAATAGMGPHHSMLERYVLHLQGLLDRDPDALQTVVESHRALRTGHFNLLDAVEDAAAVHAERGRRDEAIALVEEALAGWIQVGAPRPIARLTARLRELGVRRGVSGARGRPATGWDSLTEAELRVADLVADGLTYREIGERLFLSRRTVESHVAHMFTKLDLSSRHDLARVVLDRRQ